MNTTKLKKFAQFARRSLIEQVGSKLNLVLKVDSPERRELPTVVSTLETKLNIIGKDQLIEQAAYIWFNRFCALRFMDVNTYNRVGVLSPVAGQFQPEILAEAKAGHIDESVVVESARAKIFGLLNGSVVSRDGQSEAYRLLIVAVCNDYHRLMPYLFERIEDYTELLMPDDLLSGNSILAYTREAMTPEVCQSVECIGWLYQFYISEKKEKVFEDLKKNKKITPENIPAATQLFTPHWIVRYLVENSLGRLWMLNNPNSKVIEQMEYYIKPVEQESDFLKISSPEEIKICDPACGSGHMLTYAYDLLYAIYLDAAYDPVDIPALILTKNLYGIEIDQRAAELAAFALSMKAIKGNPKDDSNNRRRFFRNPIKPNICQLENIHISEETVKTWQRVLGTDIFTPEVIKTLSQFEEADNFGSLIQPILTDASNTFKQFEQFQKRANLSIGHPEALTKEQASLVNTRNFESAKQIVLQADYLSPKYHVVVANPPYMGGKGMNARLARWLKDNYSDVKSDLFSAFILRNTSLALEKGQLGFMTPFVWMFISSYEKLRKYLINQKTITSLIQLEYSGFDGATVPICTFTIENNHKPDHKGGYVRLSDFKGAINQAPKALEAIQNPECGWFFRASAEDFIKIPGSPVAYWVSEQVKNAFLEGEPLKKRGDTRQGMATSDNNRFLRSWWEVTKPKLCLNAISRDDANESGGRWFPYNKGGSFRKWYGNVEHVVNWENDGSEIVEYAASLYGSATRTIKSMSEYFKPSVSWSKISSGNLALRYYPNGFIFDVAGCCIFTPDDEHRLKLTGFMNSYTARRLLTAISPTLNFEVGHVASLPILDTLAIVPTEPIQALINVAKMDWDSEETSWDFTTLPLFSPDHRGATLEDSYATLSADWQSMTDEMKALEEGNNLIFIDAYGLQDELTPEVPLQEITLTCNPHYRYAKNKSEAELEQLLLADTMREFISYAVGCMFGRYSLDKQGLILANQGDTLEAYLKHVPKPSFMPDDDNAMPLIDFEGDWFEDDISNRFKQFLKVTFGEQHYSANLAFIEDAIGKDIKKYFTKDFYDDHVKRYKKRPIYWLFSSPKGTFNALIYMHRYRPDTVSVVLNDYLREFRTKLQARKESYEQIEISASASQKDKTQAIKNIVKINKVLDEVNDYERDILYPLAGQNIEIDLDDGVKANYPKFGKALKKVAGLS